MAAEGLGEQIQETLLSVFRKGTRHQVEKIATVLAFVVLSVLSVAWGLSGKGPENILEAEFGTELITEINKSTYFLANRSGDDWHNLRVVINNSYLYKADEQRSLKRQPLGPKDFKYFYYIPRAWGTQPTDVLAKAEKAGPIAPSNLDPTVVNIRTDEGRIDLKRTPDGTFESDR